MIVHLQRKYEFINTARIYFRAQKHTPPKQKRNQAVKKVAGTRQPNNNNGTT